MADSDQANPDRGARAGGGGPSAPSAPHRDAEPYISADQNLPEIILDQVLAARGSQFRTPVLAVAVGIYLPFELSVPILAGGLVAHFSERLQKRRAAAATAGSAATAAGEHVETAARHGLLFGAG